MTGNLPQTEQPGAPQRVDAIDSFRGVALFAMVIYHLVWLLNLYGYTRFELFTDPFWLFARTAILSSFLLISGFVVGLAGTAPRSWSRYLRRLGILVAAALLVTLGTLFSFPEAYIFFGVLHCLSVSAVLLLAFLRLPWWTVGVIGALWIVVPYLPQTPTFDQPWLLWLGLVSRLPITNDYVPLFPWFGVVLLGLSAGRLAKQTALWPTIARAVPAPLFLTWPGRHTLQLYIAHPPIILGFLTVAAQIAPPPGARQDETSVFLNQCMTGCREIEQSVGQCTTYCACVLTGLHEAELWSTVRTGGLDENTQRQLIEITVQCRPERQISVPPLPEFRPTPDAR